MNADAPRYLVEFHPKKISHLFTDVLIIGGGLAGLRAAIACDPGLSCMVITKDDLADSNSNYAQGGIAGVLDPLDHFDSHVQDTLTAGGTLCNEEVVRNVIRQAPDRIHELIALGTRFDHEEGELQLGREGGHSHHRIVHALGDSTGKEVMRAVAESVASRENVTTLKQTFTLDLLTFNGRCRGAIVADRYGRKFMIWAKETILCTGGAGRLYRESTNPSVATADGHAIALRAGAEVRDMEFMQFHPTVLYIAGSSRSLITEAVRGEGARLIDRNGHRFMADYDERLELAPRDVVSQAIVSQMEKTQHPNVYLDMSHLGQDFVRNRFPGIRAICQEFGIDITTDRIPVRPGAHYMIGGITVDETGRSTLDGLWAAGEVTSSGLHGANRLASNSLLEGLVYGAQAGEFASRSALAQPDTYQAFPIESHFRQKPQGHFDLDDVKNSLTSLMWRCAGVRREGDRLREAEEMIESWRSYILNCHFDGKAGWELQNMLEVGRLVVKAALKRTESRGVHLRVDFPDVDDQNWRCHVAFRDHESYLSPIA